MERTGWFAILGLAGLCAVAGAAAGPDGVLQEKGLHKAGTYYILPDEADVAKMADSVRGLQKKMIAAVARQQAVDAQAEENRQLILGFTQQRRQLRQQLARASSVTEHNQIVETMNELGDRVTLLAEGTDGDQQAQKEVAAAVAERRETFVQRLLDANNLIEEVDKKYADLSADPEVKKAIEEVNQGAKSKVALGPSLAYRNQVKALKRSQGAVHSETIPLRENHGTFEVDVTLNGKVTKAMIFDTGASSISLSEGLAAKAGLKPTDDDPTVHVETADGRTHKGKLMRLKSVRVGKFTVEDVECVVMAGDLDAPPLLGGSFLKHFTYKLVPAAGKLTLSKIAGSEGGETAKRPTRGAGKKAAASKAEGP